MHLRHIIAQMRNVRAHKVIDAVMALTAVAQHHSTVESTVGREVEIQPGLNLIVYVSMIYL